MMICAWRKKGLVKILVVLFILFFLFMISITQNRDINSSNKSLEREIEYAVDMSTGSNIFHLSFDDVIACLEDISSNEYESIFENNFFSWLKSLHDQYGCVISLYVYYENDDFSLAKCTDKYIDEFKENGEWLRFGFHAKNDRSSYGQNSIENDYYETIYELERIVGSEQIDNVIRIHGFEGTKEGISNLKKLTLSP